MDQNKCQGCSRHCERSNLQCKKGEAYFNREIMPDSERTPHKDTHPEHHERKSHGHRHCPSEFPTGSLADLMAKCGHRLFHKGDVSMFSVLTESEQQTLKDLLAKLLQS